MKTFTTFTAAAITLVASVELAAAGWRPNTPGHSWADYCTPGGAQVDSYHVCYESEIDVLNEIRPNREYPDFKGYFAPDRKKFVILEDNTSGMLLETKNYWFYTQPKSDKKAGKKCSEAVVFKHWPNHKKKFLSWDIVCQPGGKAVKLPRST